MKKTLLFFLYFIPIVTFSQIQKNDTIVKLNGQKIICTITYVNQANIYYIKTTDIEEISFSKVDYFVQLGKRYTQNTFRYGQAKSDSLNTYQNIGISTNTNTNKKVVINKNKLDSISISNELNYMRECFVHFHDEYKGGVYTALGGAALSFAGAYLISTSSEPSKYASISLIGGAVTIIGTIIMIDSHKWIGRAGLGLSGNGLSVYYIFK